jgi:C-8 sterol isomerase
VAYVFEPVLLQHLATKAIQKDLPVDDLIREVQSDLFKTYPGHISRFPKWILNNAGGAMGAMCVLHASLTEYVMIFGTPLGTEGHSGRFFVDDYFIILAGEQWAFSAGQFEREIYRPGDMHHLPKRHAKQYKIPDMCWALEYARGPIPTMLPFGLVDTFTSTLDFRSLLQTLWMYAKGVTKELRQGKI